jgi:hypothetical protein
MFLLKIFKKTTIISRRHINISAAETYQQTMIFIAEKEFYVRQKN